MTTKKHKKYWKERKIDWRTAYFDTWNHPHRQMIIDELKHIPFTSILEFGCASGLNLYRISQEFPNVKIGGVDINSDAIELCQKIMPGGVFVQDSIEDVFFSDKSVDVVLADAALIYIGPSKIDRVVKEMKRIARNNIILVEFHASVLKRIGVWWSSGYFAYNYKKLLSKHGFYDITMKKIPTKIWGPPWSFFGYVITAKI